MDDNQVKNILQTIIKELWKPCKACNILVWQKFKFCPHCGTEIK